MRKIDIITLKSKSLGFSLLVLSVICPLSAKDKESDWIRVQSKGQLRSIKYLNDGDLDKVFVIQMTLLRGVMLELKTIHEEKNLPKEDVKFVMNTLDFIKKEQKKFVAQSSVDESDPVYEILMKWKLELINNIERNE